MEQPQRPRPMGLPVGRDPASVRQRIEGMERLLERSFVVPGINHLLVPARTGEVEEYPSLPVKVVDAGITDPLIAWLKEVLAPKG